MSVLKIRFLASIHECCCDCIGIGYDEVSAAAEITLAGICRCHCAVQLVDARVCA